MKRRRLYFRGLRFKLECGHVEEETTSFYRLSKSRAACLVGSFIRRGVFCDKCKALCQVVEYLGTCRIIEAN